MWSLPGGKIEAGEGSLAAAKRELCEETGLGNKNSDDFNYIWCEDGPVCITDSIHRDTKDDHNAQEEIRFHYVISQWFVEVMSSCKERDPKPPTLVASDDAADAKWLDLKSIKDATDRGEVTSGVEKVILRSELMYDKGLLS